MKAYKHKQKIIASVIITFLAACLLFVLPAIAQDDDAIRVFPDEVVAQVSPFAFGANYGPLSFVPFELYAEAEQSGITFLRFPGGRWGDLNDIQPFHIDNYMETVRMIGATPSIHVRLENGTPEAAADLVRYANIEKDYNIRYWYIGNEPNLFHDYTVAEHSVQWRAIAQAMREVDPDIFIIGPELSQWNGTPAVDPVDPDGVDWLRGFLEANGDIVDIVAVHRYPFPRSMANPVTTVEELRANAEEWTGIVDRLRAVVVEVTGREDVPVGLTEVNSHWSSAQFGEASPDSHFQALWWADALGRVLMQEPFIVAYFELQTPTSRGAWGLLGRYEVRPVYYVYQMYQQFGEAVLATQSDLQYLTAYAALREDGALTIIAINRDDQQLSAPLDLNGFDGTLTEVHLLTEDILGEQVENDYLLDGVLTLPPRSIALFIIQP